MLMSDPSLAVRAIFTFNVTVCWQACIFVNLFFGFAQGTWILLVTSRPTMYMYPTSEINEQESLYN